MKLQDLIGKTISSAELMEPEHYIDRYVRLGFTDGTSVVLESDSDYYVGFGWPKSSEREYAGQVRIASDERVQMLNLQPSQTSLDEAIHQGEHKRDRRGLKP